MQSIKAERVRQGLKGKQLAQRLGVSAARISVLERDEARGAVTLAMLQKAAMALDCELEYQLVPKRSAGGKPRLKLQFQQQDDAYSIKAE